jgi:hypothetical protein
MPVVKIQGQYSRFMQANFPPETGGVAAALRKSGEAHLSAADGVVSSSEWCVSDHPVCAWIMVATRLLLDGASTPPVSGGELLYSKISQY